MPNSQSSKFGENAKMNSFTLLTSEQECQTVLQCTPHILEEDGTTLVQSANMCQTEITIKPEDSDVDLQSLLGYLPSEKIEHDAVYQIKPYRKIKIKFILPKKSLPESEQTIKNRESSKTEITSDDDGSDHSVTDINPQKNKDDEVAKICPILKKTVGRAFPTESIECQTTLFVYPHFLNDNEIGTVTAETSIQTAFTFTPQCSLSNILPKLKSYLHHDGRVIDCGDGFKRNNVIDFIRELLGDIVSMHENLFDPNCILPELPINLALDVGKSTYTNTETNSSSTATNTGKSLELISASTSPSPSVKSINEYKSPKQSVAEIERDTSAASKYLSELITRPTCDCCNYSPCCSDIQINIIIDRQPFDKCCSKTSVDQQVAAYFPQQPVDSIIKDLLEEIINNITKSVPNKEKQLIRIGNTDYSQQFDFNSMHDPQSLQIVPYVPSMLEEIVKEKMKNIDPFKFCTEVGTQCDCKNEEEQITKWTPNQRSNLLVLPSTSIGPDLEFGLIPPTISKVPTSVSRNKLAVSLHSKIAEKIPNKIHICKCPKDKPTVGCFCCSENIEVAAEAILTVCSTLQSFQIDNPYLDIEDKSIQTPSLKAIEYNIQKEEGPKISDSNMRVEDSMVEMYQTSQNIPVHQSVQIDFGPEQRLSLKPSKVVTIQDNVFSEYHIPLKRTHEKMHLSTRSPENNLELCMEGLRIELTDDTDEETDDDYTTATSSPTNTKNPENVDENDPERKASREEMMKLLLDLKIIDSSVNQHQLETLTKPKQTLSDVSKKSTSVESKFIRSFVTNIASTKSISKNSERKKNFLNLYKMTDTCSAMSSVKSLQPSCVSQPSQMITIIAQALKSDYPSIQALYFSKDISAPLSIISKKRILSTQPSTTTNNVQFILLEDDGTDSEKRCLPNCSEHIISTKCLECANVKNIEPENICAETGLPKPPIKVCATTENLKPPTKTVSINSNTTCKTLSTQERVISAVRICESQLQPLRDAFIDLKQKLKQLNIPEVNCIFETNEVDTLNSNKFRIRVATNPDPSKCGIHTTNTKIKLVPPTKPSSSYSNVNVSSSRVSSRQSCRSVRNAQCYLPNNYPFVTPRCQSASQDWKRYYSCLLHYDENAPCLRRPSSTRDNFSKCGMMKNKGFQASSSSSSYCSLNVARTQVGFECSNNASQYNFSHVSSEEFEECPYRNNNYYPGNYMNGSPRYNYY